ncbi:ABC transporter permease [Mycoplasmopsis columbina]|uniref:Spermidine/putrescine ABC transporter permease protein n=1 Tax=Mycoplasmopsis columbina SF7 TaxID=1037410 RepID=F9UJX7_9BACT|nr:ABC transporter permease [Mycoplasmopsis columbina]EGV00323.1 spermidine/putrescine ABC transporter permease protein [Mycoplasmopsis columbina SF7]VEU76812.1 polyamine (spermidine/putrescine) ABC transporter permease [Mycoplasmopsis columbina]
MLNQIKNKLSLNKRLTLLLPFVVIAIFFILLPIILIIINAFTPRENFDTFLLLKEKNTWIQIGRSLKIGVISSLICLLLGFPYAYFIATSKNKYLPIYGMSLILSPMIIFTIARIYAIRGFFLAVVPTEDTLNAEWFMVLALTYLNLPFMIMPLYSVFKDMPKNIIEASEDLGYNKFQTLLKVVVPYSLKAIISGLGLIFLSSATNFVISDKLLPNKNQLQTIGSVINDYTVPSNEYLLSRGSVLVLVVSAIFIGSYALIQYAPKLFAKFSKKGWRYE